MVVIAIIGILAGIAVPRLQTFRALAIQSEAKTGLNGLYLSMQAYQVNYGQFLNQTTATNPPVAVIPAVGFQVGGNNPKYNCSLISNLGGWSAFAISQGALLGGNFDTHRINTNKMTCTPFDAVIAAAPAVNVTQTFTAGLCTESALATGATRPDLREPADCKLGTTGAGCIAVT
jgi:type II secretory pathway pseudopilin PulG